jgi:hypothetical protein
VSKNEQSAEQPERAYFYYRCDGKFEDRGGGRNCICGGHIFTLETRMYRCPVCDQPLKIIKADKELPEAKTCALAKCASCKNRERSPAVNDEHCLGGDTYKKGRLQKTLGFQLCNGCQCTICCKEIIEDADAVKKYGFIAVIKAQAELREIAMQVLREGNINAASQKKFDEIEADNPPLRGIRHETRGRWVQDAYEAAKKNLADEKKRVAAVYAD